MKKLVIIFKPLYVLLTVLFMNSAMPVAAVSEQKDWLPPPSETVMRIAFGSCAFQWDEQKIWDTVVAKRPDLFLFIGDAIYGDFDGKKVVEVSRETLEADWKKVASKPTFQRLRKNVPVMATWDNHDYGKNDGGAEFELKDISKKVFLDFFGEPENSARRKTPGIYDTRIIGPLGKRVQVILLDTRYFKGPFLLDKRTKEEKKALGLSGTMGKYAPNNDPKVSLLGKDQWQWLEDQLRKEAEIRFIVSSTQIIPDEKGMDEWGNYPLERQKLFDLISQTNANGVILLSGNVHYAEVSKIKTKTHTLLDFTSSGLTHTNKVYPKAGNSYRVAGPFIGLNFGLIEIDWDASPYPLITLKAVGEDGSTAFEHKASLAELQPDSSASGKTLTYCKEPRPQICTREYRLVCAQMRDGSYKEYSNGCTSCTDQAVNGYYDGACEAQDMK
ncbi:MAG: alkaline phosphatase family protein [Planctomycetes bacterium]|nr:alkaline phosphatase family protein [Planctomycetota bacterium]